MASFMSTATSTQPGCMCACGYHHFVLKISCFARNPGHAYYQCPRGVVSTNTFTFTFPCQTLTNIFFNPKHVSVGLGDVTNMGAKRLLRMTETMSLVLRFVSFTLNKLCVYLQ
ncbi:hypothetical protein CsSME_00014286 [Camellia sinensis var. sinensis]